MPDRRFEPRHPVSEPVELSWSTDSDTHETCSGVLNDLSRSGARIRLIRTVRLNTAVRITIRGEELGATVSSCVRAYPGYAIGIEFNTPYPGTITPR
jgi:hypothetical protein